MTIGIGVTITLVVAALVPPLRPALVLVLALGAALAPRGSALIWSSAAGLPVAIILAWGGLVGNQLQADVSGCGDLLSPIAILRVAEAVVVVAVVALLARRLGVSVRSLGLHRPSATEAGLGVLAIAIIPVASLHIGSIIAEPFFGPISLDLAQPLAIVPALALAVANGTMEELAYRGALMSWGSKVLGPAVALVGQAIVFGVAHTGSDYVAEAVPVVLAVTVGGLLAGLIVRRTGSLFLPIVVHICFDVPLFYALACRFGQSVPA